MATHPFRQVDVFGSAAYTGNPLAVVAAADDVTEEDMRRFARWTNLAETVFLLDPTTAGADYRVRIFTTTVELPFAGHPTLGSAHAWLAWGGRPVRDDVVVQECAAGLVEVRVAGDRLAFAAPPMTRFEPVAEPLAARVAAGLGVGRDAVLGCSWLVNRPEWIGVRLADAERVLALRPDPGVLAGLEVGVVGPHRAGAGADFEVRAFIAADGSVVEDPATGSLNAGLARWLVGEGVAPAGYVVAQGTAIGHAARLHVDVGGDAVWVGGEVRPGITGTVEI
ncbi:PhzF family phenazine biosynthesis protein [Saccharothrix syringae]|uniref:PhzF family phenazine biosynthesis protein n=1 Tax=Saccharothrix syringae TaxID=103733 RepID=A0A5Q0H0J4_SACSY|nr:PhzF family phenazine biosynthesis protein [Saccharothrix syringae]QFZ19435.1 PhzF family phenazine biosynthesis protein [Saccharothrix syringae]